MPRPNPRTKAEYRRIASRISSEFSAQERAAALEEIRARANVDLHFFMVVVTGNTVLTPASGLHGRVCRFLDDDGVARKWVEVFRGGLKSTMQVAMNARAGLRDPESRNLIVSATHPLAKSFLRDVKRIVESKTVRVVYPDVVPMKDLWNQSEAAVRYVGRRRQAREATWGTAGIDVGVTGTHWSRVSWDDLATAENTETRDGAQAVIGRFKSLRPLLDSYDTPEFMFSTPYEIFDLSEWLKKEHPGWFTRLSIPVEDAQGEPAWPEEFPKHHREQLQRVMGPKVYGSQYLLNPRCEGAQVFFRRNIRYWRRPDEPEMHDWSAHHDLVRPVVKDLHEMTLYLGWDPATGVEGGDDAAFSVVGADAFGNFYVVDAVFGSFNLQEQMDLFFMLQEQYADFGGIAVSAVEMQGPFASLGPSLTAEMDARRQWYNVEKADIRNQNKAARVRLVLQPKYMQGRVYHHHALLGGAMEKQLLEFPGRHDDICDAVSHAMDVAGKYGGSGWVGQEDGKTAARSSFGMARHVGYTLSELERLCPELDEREALGRTMAVGLFG